MSGLLSSAYFVLPRPGFASNPLRQLVVTFLQLLIVRAPQRPCKIPATVKHTDECDILGIRSEFIVCRTQPRVNAIVEVPQHRLSPPRQSRHGCRHAAGDARPRDSWFRNSISRACNTVRHVVLVFDYFRNAWSNWGQQQGALYAGVDLKIGFRGAPPVSVRSRLQRDAEGVDGVGNGIEEFPPQPTRGFGAASCRNWIW